MFKYTGEDLGKIYRTLQEIFTEYAYLSYDNVVKVTNPEDAFKAMEIDAMAAIMPLQRCEVRRRARGEATKSYEVANTRPSSQRCTLIPPCKHITAFDLAQLGKERRRALPKRGPESLTCARFAATGRCPAFNRLGRCSCNHPLDVHTVRYPPARCGVCSLPKPCGKCEYTKRRMEVRGYQERKKWGWREERSDQ